MSMADRDGFIWLDGKLVPWREAQIHVLTHSLHYGLSVFEGERAYPTSRGPAIFRLREHTDRLFNSAHIYRMAMPYSREQIMAACCEVVAATSLTALTSGPLPFMALKKWAYRPRVHKPTWPLPPGLGGPTWAKTACKMAFVLKPRLTPATT